VIFLHQIHNAPKLNYDQKNYNKICNFLRLNFKIYN